MMSEANWNAASPLIPSPPNCSLPPQWPLLPFPDTQQRPITQTHPLSRVHSSPQTGFRVMQRPRMPPPPSISRNDTTRPSTPQQGQTSTNHYYGRGRGAGSWQPRGVNGRYPRRRPARGTDRGPRFSDQHRMARETQRTFGPFGIPISSEAEILAESENRSAFDQRRGIRHFNSPSPNPTRRRFDHQPRQHRDVGTSEEGRFSFAESRSSRMPPRNVTPPPPPPAVSSDNTANQSSPESSNANSPNRYDNLSDSQWSGTGASFSAAALHENEVPQSPSSQHSQELAGGSEPSSDPSAGGNFLDCHICMNDYNDDRTVPRLLPCGHTFCEECLLHFGKRECAVCRQEYKGSVHSLYKNSRLVDVNKQIAKLEKLAHTRATERALEEFQKAALKRELAEVNEKIAKMRETKEQKLKIVREREEKVSGRISKVISIEDKQDYLNTDADLLDDERMAAEQVQGQKLRAEQEYQDVYLSMLLRKCQQMRKEATKMTTMWDLNSATGILTNLLSEDRLAKLKRYSEAVNDSKKRVDEMSEKLEKLALSKNFDLNPAETMETVCGGNSEPKPETPKSTKSDLINWFEDDSGFGGDTISLPITHHNPVDADDRCDDEHPST